MTAVVAAILYATFFRLIGVEGDLWLWGLIGGLIHYVVAGPIVAIIPSLNPDTGELPTQGSRTRTTTRWTSSPPWWAT